VWLNPKTGKGWSDREEEVIAQLMANKSCSRIQAIQEMRRRKLDDLRGGTSVRNAGLPSPGSPVGVLIQRIIEKRPAIGYEEARALANALLDRAAGKKVYRMPTVRTVEKEQARKEQFEQLQIARQNASGSHFQCNSVPITSGGAPRS